VEDSVRAEDVTEAKEALGKTGNVEKLRKPGDMLKSLDEYVEKLSSRSSFKGSCTRSSEAIPLSVIEIR
jgi:hypothetical protein